MSKIEKPSIFGQWCEITGWHGIFDFYIAKNVFVKFFWLLIVLIGCFLAINQSVSLISDFITSDQWITSITYKLPSNGHRDWPNLMVCGVNWPGHNYEFDSKVPFNDSDAIKVLLGRNEEEENESARIYEAKLEEESGVSLESVFEQLAGNITKEIFNKTEFDSNICNNVVVHCGNTASAFDLKKKNGQCCGVEQNNHDDGDGSCFQLSPTRTFNSTTNVLAGHSNSIYYLLNPHLHSYFGHILYPGAGLEIRMFTGETNAYHDYGSKFLLAPGTHNVISMTLEKYRLAQNGRKLKFYNPDKDCDNKEYEYLQKGEYTMDKCDYDCAMKWWISICKCYPDPEKTDFHFPLEAPQNYKKCDAEEYNKCNKIFIDSNNINKRSNPDNPVTTYWQCLDRCLDQCSYERIEAKISNSLFMAPNKIKPFTKYLNKAKAQIDKQWVDLNEDEVGQLIMLEMYYERKQNRIIEKTPRLSIEELISNIGGCVSVWSGISLISIVQIFFYVCKSFGGCTCCQRRNQVDIVKFVKQDSGMEIKT